jgi:DNA-binding winged helix-turn-helix (wHTH) protein/tetratricopeptide (TPR) repeat protein
MSSRRYLAFPPFRLDVAGDRLLRGSDAVALTPKALAVLRHLIDNRNRLVTKEELLNTVWAGVHVSGAVLKSCILDIRRALDDPVRSPRFIETVHRRGYRFVAALTRVEGTAGDRSGAGRLPIVGRERELADLRACLERALDGESQIVVVTGEPGIGKTTLVEAFLREAESQHLYVAWGQCVEHAGAGESYLPILHAIGRLCRGPAGERLTPILRKYAPTWLAQMPSLIDPEDREALQREIFGATSERMLREMVEAVEALTVQVPLVLVLEDLHWSDPATIDLLSTLARRRDEVHLLVLATFRDTEVAGPRHPLSAAMHELHMHRLCVEIRPSLLDDAAVKAYLVARFPDHRFPEGLSDLIHERTDGNPLFLADVVDDLVREGVIVQGRDGWRLRLALEDIRLSVPASLRHMIDRQFDRLTPEERRFLEAASVDGDDFSVQAVAAALEVGTEQVETWCESLIRRQEFVKIAGIEDGPADVAASRYGFIHSLYRHAIVARLATRRRIRLHQRIGEYKEATRGDRAAAIAPELAVHFEQSRDHDRVIHYLRQAASNAVRQHANGAALGYLQRALAIADRGPEHDRTQQMRLFEQVGRVCRSMGDMTRAAEAFAAWAAVARRYGRPRDEVRALLYQSSALSWVDRERSLAAASDAATLSRHLGDPLLHTRALGHQAFGRLLARGWSAEDAQACTDAMESARRAGDRFALNLHVARSAYLLCHRSQYEAACSMAREGLRLSMEFHDPFHYMSCQFHQGWALLHHGELGQALDVLTDGLQVADRNGHRAWARVFRFGMAWVHVQAFDFGNAQSLCERELEQPPEPRLGQFLGQIILAMANLGLGERDNALQVLNEVVNHVERGDGLMDWILRMPLHLALAQCRLARGELASARRHAKQLCDFATQPPERTYLSLGWHMLAEITLSARDDAQAESELSKALATLEGAHCPLAEWRVHETAAALWTRRRQLAQAKRHRATSAATLERLIESLRGWPELQRSFRSAPQVRAITDVISRTAGGVTTSE